MEEKRWGWPLKSYVEPSPTLTLYTPTLVCIFSLLFSIHLLTRWQGEFVEQSRASLAADHFLYSRDPNVWFGGLIVRRN